MDIWGVARQPLFGFPRLDYAMIGRWFGHMTHGTFRHDAIAAAPAVPRERLIGWAVHYLIGVTFAALLIAIWGPAWGHHPTLGPALIVGVSTVAAPLLVMQPAMGAGIAASKTSHPASARLQSLLSHTIYGVGLYLSALALHLFQTP